VPAGRTTTAAAGGGRPLSPLIHGRVRLLVVAHLFRHGPTPFTELRALLQLTDGTLSVHLGKLEEGGIVELVRRFVGKRPRTVVRLTRRGRNEFRRYIEDLRSLIPELDRE